MRVAFHWWGRLWFWDHWWGLVWWWGGMPCWGQNTYLPIPILIRHSNNLYLGTGRAPSPPGWCGIPWVLVHGYITLKLPPGIQPPPHTLLFLPLFPFPSFRSTSLFPIFGGHCCEGRFDLDAGHAHTSIQLVEVNGFLLPTFFVCN